MLQDDLFTAAELTQRTLAELSGQLRRFLDERSWHEGRRIHVVIRATLAAALTFRDTGLRPPGAAAPVLRADIVLPMERPLWTPREAAELDSATAEDDTEDEPDFTALYDLNRINLEALRASLAGTVARRSGVATLAQVVADHPLSEGLAGTGRLPAHLRHRCRGPWRAARARRMD